MKKEKPDGTSRSQLRLGMSLLASVAGLGGTGVGLWLLGPAASFFLGLLFLLALVGLAGSVVFSPREEPSKRLRKLIKEVRRRRRR